MLGYKEIAIRLILSAILGGLIGIEREVSNRPAGLRTHILVTLGSALIMLISIDGFYDAKTGMRMGDPSRLAAQVVSGIGFLGAGTIMRTESRVKGLTTAASLWVCAGIGLAIGNGYYMGGLLTSGMVLITLMGLRVVESKGIGKKFKTLEVIAVGRPGLIGDIGTTLGEYRVRIRDIFIMIDDNIELDESYTHPIIEIHIMVKIPTGLKYEELLRKISEIEGIQKTRF